MVRSQIYREAARAVIISPMLNTDDKIEILRVLMGNEDTERFIENMKEKKVEANGEL